LTHSFPQKLPSRCLNAPRNFSQTSIAYKKGGKATREEKNSSAAEKSSAVEDPNDFSTLEAGIQKILTRLQHELSKLRTGGRFNPELLEGVRVQLKKDNKQSIRLGDLAQVVPKGGKSIVVLVGEADVSRII
jgi:ribosome recycling factor